MLCRLPKIKDPRVLVGNSTSDDAAAYQMDDGNAILQTLDFITPIVDDPFQFGRIAAANSLSDVYAMGGRPLFALNIVCFPSKQVPLDVLGEILIGGADAAREAGIEIVGGHSVDDPEPKYGLVVTGIVPINKILTNAGAQVGDQLFLTKPLGSGVLTTAMKKDRVSASVAQQVTEVMGTLNKSAAEALDGLEINAVTDVTGFSLMGHLLEMLQASHRSARINCSAVPILPEVISLVADQVFPGGASRNRKRTEPHIQWEAGVDEPHRIALNDPQTSGGLLIAASEACADELEERLTNAGTLAAARIGEIVEGEPSTVFVSEESGE